MFSSAAAPGSSLFPLGGEGNRPLEGVDEHCASSDLVIVVRFEFIDVAIPHVQVSIAPVDQHLRRRKGHTDSFRTALRSRPTVSVRRSHSQSLQSLLPAQIGLSAIFRNFGDPPIAESLSINQFQICTVTST